MLKLYQRDYCPFCKKVTRFASEKGIQLELLDISNENTLQELIHLGGQQMVPFLVDEERSEMMYESADIIKYLDEHYGG